MKNSIPTGGEMVNALKRSWGEATEGVAIETPEGAAVKCTKKFACRCAECIGMFQSMREFREREDKLLRAKGRKKIHKQTIKLSTVSGRQPKSLPGQLSLLDVIGE